MKVHIVSESSNIGKDLETVSKIIQIINEEGNYPLLPEVITWALLNMKKNPEMSISEAIISGYNEWIK